MRRSLTALFLVGVTLLVPGTSRALDLDEWPPPPASRPTTLDRFLDRTIEVLVAGDPAALVSLLWTPQEHAARCPGANRRGDDFLRELDIAGGFLDKDRYPFPACLRGAAGARRAGTRGGKPAGEAPACAGSQAHAPMRLEVEVGGVRKALIVNGIVRIGDQYGLLVPPRCAGLDAELAWFSNWFRTVPEEARDMALASSLGELRLYGAPADEALSSVGNADRSSRLALVVRVLGTELEGCILPTCPNLLKLLGTYLSDPPKPQEPTVLLAAAMEKSARRLGIEATGFHQWAMRELLKAGGMKVVARAPYGPVHGLGDPSGPEPAAGRKNPRIAGRLSMGGMTAQGFCARSNIQSVVMQRAGALRACYEAQLQIHPALAGKVTVRWTIGEDGRVEGAVVAETTLGNDAVEACVLRAVGHLRFAAPAGGRCAVQWPLVFRPGEDASDARPEVIPAVAPSSPPPGASTR